MDAPVSGDVPYQLDKNTTWLGETDLSDFEQIKLFKNKVSSIFCIPHSSKVYFDSKCQIDQWIFRGMWGVWRPTIIEYFENGNESKLDWTFNWSQSCKLQEAIEQKKESLGFSYMPQSLSLPNQGKVSPFNYLGVIFYFHFTCKLVLCS